MRVLCPGIVLWMVVLGLASGALGQSAPAASPPAAAAAPPSPVAHGLYVVAYRTPRHISYSSPDIFHGITQTVLDFLSEHHVPVMRDPERETTIETSELFSTDSMVRLAREAGAGHLLYVTVDRPLTKWVKITVQCYDLAGKQLWQEEASNGGGMSGKGGLAKTLTKLREQLQARAGQTCLAGDAPPATAPAKP